MDTEMICREERGTVRHYDFRCPSCDEAGDLGLERGEIGTVPCPGDCGAVFVEYESPKGWALRCVVQPFYASDGEKAI